MAHVHTPNASNDEHTAYRISWIQLAAPIKKRKHCDITFNETYTRRTAKTCVIEQKKCELSTFCFARSFLKKWKLMLFPSANCWSETKKLLRFSFARNVIMSLFFCTILFEFRSPLQIRFFVNLNQIRQSKKVFIKKCSNHCCAVKRKLHSEVCILFHMKKEKDVYNSILFWFVRIQQKICCKFLRA